MLKEFFEVRAFSTFLICASLLFAASATWCFASQLRLTLPGQSIAQVGENPKAASAGWYALSLRDGTLVLERASQLVPSTKLSANGTHADQLFNRLSAKHPDKPMGLSLPFSSEAILYMRIDEDNGEPRKFIGGKFPSAVSTTVLEEGWSANGEIGTNIDTNQWHFFTQIKKRADGKLLAGSLELMAQRTSSNPAKNAKKTILPKAFGMAFAKQELLWLGDLNQDGEPDLLVRRTWITDEMDYVLVISPMLASAYYDPDYPSSYFVSGVAPESNTLEWYKNVQGASQPNVGNLSFSTIGSFRVSEKTWKNKLNDADLSLPQLLNDSVLKLNGETVRVSLEHLPRIESFPSQDSNATETGSQSTENIWDGSVLLRVTFRGKSQVLMQLQAPDGDDFVFSIGLIDGKPSIRLNYHPHYNNSFQRYWIYDEAEKRFRRVLNKQEQGC